MKVTSQWELFRQGDERAFRELYERCWKQLYTYAARVMRDREEARDRVQELFIRLWNKRAGLPEVQNPEAYLFRCMKHLVLNQLHSRQITEKHLKAFERVAAREEETTAAYLHEKEIRREVLSRASELPERMREAFYLHRIRDLPVSEVARHLNISEQTVRNQVNLAVKRIRPVLETVSATLFMLFLG